MYKFRGKRIDNGEWVKGDRWHDPFANKMYIKTLIEGGTLLHDYEVHPASVGQYRGVVGKDKTDVYDGDIVSVNKNCYAIKHGDWGRAVDVVEMGLRTWLKHEEFGHEGENLVSPYHCEVIGNTTENPELLAKEQEDA